MSHTKLALALGLSASLASAFAVEMPADYTHLGWIESDKSAKQWINTKYVPKVSTVITGRFQLKDRSGSWVSLLGAFNVNDNSQNGVLLRFNNNSYNIEGIFCNDHSKRSVSCSSGGDYDFLLKRRYFKIGDTERTYDDGNCYEETKMPGFSTPIYVFAECNAGTPRRQQPTRFYWLTFADEDGTQRDFRPCMNAEGKCGFWDRVEGVFYGNQATGDDFAYGGIAFTKNPESGAMAVTAGGALSAEDIEGVKSITIKMSQTTDALEAGVVTSLDALAVNAGAFSLQDDKAATCEVSGAVTLAGGTELKFDVTENGVDAISAGSVVFTGEGTVKISVRGVGTTSLAADQAILSGCNLTDADLAKFTLAAGVPCELKVENGELVLAVKAADAVTWTGTSGNWSAPENWADGKKPGVGAPVTIDQTAGGTANQDISDLSINSLTYAADAGSFTLTGGGLGIATKIDAKTAAAQTLNLPLTLGTSGKTAEIAAAGGLVFNGDLTLNGTRTEIAVAEGKAVDLGVVKGGNTLAVEGPGTVRLTKDSPAFGGNIEVTGGTLQNMREVPFADDGNGDEIRVSNGGTLVIGPDNAGEDKVRFKNRKLVLSGAGVNGQGAATYNGEKHQYYAFREAELADDATVGGTKGRWDVRSQSNVGTFNFNGHTLTKVGAGQFSLSDVRVVNGDAPAGLDLNEGTVLIENSTAFTGAENTLNIGAAGRLQVYQLANPLGWTMNFAGGAQFDSQNGDTSKNVLSGPMTLGEGTVTFTTLLNHTATITGPVTGGGKLKKAGEGILYLSGGAKTFTGGVAIDKGRLYAASSDQLPGYDEGKVDITGANAGLVLNSSGWTVDAFAGLLGSMSIADASGFVGYAADTETEITTDLAHANGSVLFDGKAAPLSVKGGLEFPNGKLTVVGDVTISGKKTASFATVGIEDNDAHLTVKDGVTLTVPSKEGVNDIVIAKYNPSFAIMTVENATVTGDPLPGKGAKSSGILYGRSNNGVGLVEVGEGGVVAHKLCGAADEWSRAAMYIRKGGTAVNYGGSGNNDGYIAGSGYGYLENAGSLTFKGYSQVCNGNNIARTVGVLYTTGVVTFTQEYDGELDISRGGTGLIYQTDGTIEATKGGFQFNSQHGQERGLAVWTIEGPSAVAKGAYFKPVNKNKTESILNLREGGTLDYGEIQPRKDNYGSVETQKFHLNFAGGYLKPQKSGTVFLNGERYQPNTVVSFEGGAGFDVPADISVTLNVPVRAPTGRGIASITPEEKVLTEEYIGAPFVRIEGDGYGATAVALYDSRTRRVTGVKVTSPGCGYTTATVSLDGGLRGNNTALTATATLTDENQAYGGLKKRGAGTLVVSQAMLPDVKAPLTLEGGVLDLGGATLNVSVLMLAGGSYCNGTIVADKVVSTETAFLPQGVLAENGTIDVQDGTLTIDTVGAGLMMTLVQCADEAGVDVVINGETAIDWTKALPVVDFNRANSQQGWGVNQVLAYKGYIWNRGTTDVTWTFAEHFDDGTHVLVDGVTVLKDMTWITTNLGRVTLTPGAHTFEVRFAQKGGGAGPAGSTYHEEWPGNTLAFGLAYESTESYDVTLYDHLTDLSSGEVFTLTAEDGSAFDADGLTVEAGAGVAFNGAAQTLTYGKDLAFDAADLIAGTGTMTFVNATVAFKTGTTVTIADFEDLCQDDKVNAYVLVETTDGITGFENLTFANPAPKGWKYVVKNGKKLVLQRNIGFAIIIL